MLIAAGAASHLDQGRDRDPDLKNDPDNFLALDADGTEIGLVKWVETGPDHGWFWSTTRRRAPGPAFRRPTFGQCATRWTGGAGAGRLLRGVPGVLSDRGVRGGGFSRRAT